MTTKSAKIIKADTTCAAHFQECHTEDLHDNESSSMASDTSQTSAFARRFV